MDNNELEKDVVVSDEAAPETTETVETNTANEAAEAEVIASVEAAPEEETVHRDAPISLYDENGKKKSKRRLKKEEKERRLPGRADRFLCGA